MMHWPHWLDAIDHVLANSDMNVVVIGQVTSPNDPGFVFPWIEHPKAINLVGQVVNMIDVFHIVNEAKGIVTTSNGLSMWSIIKKKPALVACNQIIRPSAEYYYNWIHHQPNLVLDSNVCLEDFKESFFKWQKTL
jgi:hypothetical protein